MNRSSKLFRMAFALGAAFIFVLSPSYAQHQHSGQRQPQGQRTPQSLQKVYVENKESKIEATSIMPSSSDYTRSDTVTTIASLTLDSLRLSIGSMD